MTPVSRPCVSCRASKVRCDRTTPSCLRCERKGTLCQYPSPRTPRTMTTKPRKRTSKNKTQDVGTNTSREVNHQLVQREVSVRSVTNTYQVSSTEPLLEENLHEEWDATVADLLPDIMNTPMPEEDPLAEWDATVADLDLPDMTTQYHDTLLHIEEIVMSR